MEVINRILKLAEQKGITANKVAVECKLGSSAMTNWKNGKKKPSLEALIKIADFFNVSLDYLTGRGHSDFYKTLSTMQQKTILDFLKGIEKIVEKAKTGNLEEPAINSFGEFFDSFDKLDASKQKNVNAFLDLILFSNSTIEEEIEAKRKINELITSAPNCAPELKSVNHDYIHPELSAIWIQLTDQQRTRLLGNAKGMIVNEQEKIKQSN